MLRNIFLAPRQKSKVWDSLLACNLVKHVLAREQVPTRLRPNSTAAFSCTAPAPSSEATKPIRRTNQGPREDTWKGSVQVDVGTRREDAAIPDAYQHVLGQWKQRKLGTGVTVQVLAEENPTLAPYLFSPWLFSHIVGKLMQSKDHRSVIDALSFAHAFGLTQHLRTYQSLLDALTKAGEWHLCLQVVSLAINHLNVCTSTLLNRRTQALVELRRFRELEGMPEEFEAANISPDRLTYHLTLKGHLRNHDLAKAQLTMQWMEQAGYPVDASTHAIVVRSYRALGMDRTVESKAIEHLHAMPPNTQVTVLNNLLRSHLDNRDATNALRILSLFEPRSVEVVIDVLFGNGTGGGATRSPHLFEANPSVLPHPPQPNASTFALLIHYASAKNNSIGRPEKNFSAALQLLHSMMTQSIVPTIQVITAMMHACFAGKQPDLAVQLVAGVCDETMTPRSLFDSIYSGTWDGPCFEIHVPNMKVNAQIFNTLLKGILPLYGIQGGKQVMRIMHLNQVKPDERTLDLLLSHLGSIEGVRPTHLLQLLKFFAPHRITPTVKHIRIILRTIIRHEKYADTSFGWDSWRWPNLAKSRINTIPASASTDGFQGVTLPGEFDSLMKPLFDGMKRHGIQPDPALFGLRIRYEAVIRRDPDTARQVFTTMIERGIQPNLTHFCNLMYGYAMLNRVQDALQIFEIAKKSGAQPNVTLYTVLVTMHARRRKARRALRVFDEMVRKGITPDVPAIDAVVGAFYAINATKMAAKLLMVLWEWVEPFPMEFLTLRLHDLVARFRSLHTGTKPHHVPAAQRNKLVQACRTMFKGWSKERYNSEYRKRHKRRIARWRRVRPDRRPKAVEEALYNIPISK